MSGGGSEAGLAGIQAVVGTGRLDITVLWEVMGEDVDVDWAREEEGTGEGVVVGEVEA